MKYVGSGVHLSRELVQNRVRFAEDLLVQAAVGTDGEFREVLQQITGSAGFGKFPSTPYTYLNGLCKKDPCD